jgi:cytoskeletal protein RodZ
LANKRGGHDNITIIGIQMPEEKVITSVPKTRNRLVIALVLIAFLAVALMGGGIYRMYFWEGRSPTATFQQGSTTDIISPTISQTAVPTTQSPQTPQRTSEASPPPDTSVIPTSATSIPATYTPWPTSTTGP